MLKMNKIAEKYDLLTHVRNLESRHGARLNERWVSLESICDERDKDDLKAIVAFRHEVNLAEQKSVMDEKAQNIKQGLVNHLTQMEIAHENGYSVETVRKIIKGRPELMKLQKENTTYLKHRQIEQKQSQRQEYGKHIKWIRTQLVMTTKDFARQINKLAGISTCTAGQVAGWERGKSMPNPQRMGAINKLEKKVKDLGRKYG